MDTAPGVARRSAGVDLGLGSAWQAHTIFTELGDSQADEIARELAD